MRPKVFLSLCVALLAGQIGNAQLPGTDELLGRLQEYAADYPQEKVYLHLDKPYYTVGDDIWFKGYVTIGPFNNLSGLSKILYVDLIGPQDDMVQSLRLPLVAGATIGDFQLADSLREGNYRIRAYTNWMRNFETDLFYDRTISIGNTLTDNIVANSSFTFQNSQEHTVDASIVLTDFSGMAMAGVPVSYEVLLEGRNIRKGKTKTDDDGQLHINFVNKKPFILNNGNIALAVQSPEGRTVRKHIPIHSTATQNSIQFFPEGGHLIAGNMSKVGFKALRPNGRGIAVKGELTDSGGAVITTFESAHAGMGNFTFTPAEGEQYTATVAFEDGSELTENLPEIQTSGYGLMVNNEIPNTVFVQVYATDDLVSNQEITLLLQRNGNVFYASKGKLSKNEILFSIPREHIPSGVTQLTVFSPDMDPLVERTIFSIVGNDILPITLTAGKNTYGQKEKAAIDIEIGENRDTAHVAILSAAVINLEKVPETGHSERTIHSELLLKADLKGYIEGPEYYFEGLSQGGELDITKRRLLDNLMLTQGWSRIDWQALAAGKAVEITYHPEQDLRVSGMVTKRDGKTPVPNATVTLFSTNAGGAGIMDTVSGPDGRFEFDRLLFLDSTRFIVQARDERGRRNVEAVLDEVPRQQVTKNRNMPDAQVSVNQSMSTYLEKSQERFDELEKYGLRERTILIEEVKVTADAKQDRLRHSSNLNGPGRADQIIMADELLMGCPTLDICLQGRLLGVMFQNGIPYSTRSMGTPMQIILDGMFLESDALSWINPFDVESVEVLRRPETASIYGMRGGGGVLVITTKRGDSGSYSGNMYTPGIVTHSPQGYYEVREFYAPDYSVSDSLPEMRDLRTTVHWEPHIVTDDKGHASMEFYTAEGRGRYRVVVEGMDVYGRLGRAVLYLDVE